jgi:histone acetyltransferase HTATIP
MRVCVILILHSDICETTNIKREDVISTLQQLEIIHYHKGQYIIAVSSDVLDSHERAMSKRMVRIDPKALNWQPRDWTRRGKW